MHTEKKKEEEFYMLWYSQNGHVVLLETPPYLGVEVKPWLVLSQRSFRSREGSFGLEVCRGQDNFPRGERSKEGFQCPVT